MQGWHHASGRAVAIIALLFREIASEANSRHEGCGHEMSLNPQVNVNLEEGVGPRWHRFLY